jgi:hypothetical protein
LQPFSSLHDDVWHVSVSVSLSGLQAEVLREAVENQTPGSKFSFCKNKFQTHSLCCPCKGIIPGHSLLRTPARRNFAKTLSVVSLHREYPRALTFENACQTWSSATKFRPRRRSRPRALWGSGVSVSSLRCTFLLFIFLFFLVGDGGDAHYGAAGCPYHRLGVFFLFLFLLKCCYTDTEHCTLCRFRV